MAPVSSPRGTAKAPAYRCIHASALPFHWSSVTTPEETEALDRMMMWTVKMRVAPMTPQVKVRLSLAMALLTDPEVIVLDEPQNGLDPQGIIELRDLVRDLADEGRTVVVSSHQLGEIARMSDDIGVLATGRLVYEGPLTDFADADDERAMEAAFLAAVTGGGRRTETEVRA